MSEFERRKESVCMWVFFLSLFLDLELCSWFLKFFFFNLWVCVLGSEFVFLLFLFKTHLDLNSYDF